MNALALDLDKAAQNTGSFSRTETRYVQSAKKKHFPLHFLWNREADFEESVGREYFTLDEDARVQGAVMVLRSKTHQDLEDLFKELVRAAIEIDAGTDFVNAQAYDHTFGATDVRVLLYTAERDDDFHA